MKKQVKKVVLAYSGGLDTSVIIPWLKENYDNCEVIAMSGDVGQGDELDGLEAKALKTGASKLYVEDLKETFVTDYIYPAVKAGAVYEKEYLLGTALARPPSQSGLLKLPSRKGADAICHGCTGKGNDQVRFELAIKALCARNLRSLPRGGNGSSNPARMRSPMPRRMTFRSKSTAKPTIPKDKNLWHLSHEGLDLEDPANQPTVWQERVP